VSAREALVTVAVLTYRRPDDLAEALPMLLDHAEEVASPVRRVEVLVVDNDPEASGRPVVERIASPRVRYVVEPTPGIAAARNRALREAGGSDLLVFVDDDERPHPGWLSHLLATQERCGAAVVAGAVVSAFDGELDPWIEAGGFFRRRRLPTGTPIDVAATNNLLLDMARVREVGARFDPAFGITGGSDTLFTRTLSAAGARMVWCDEAVVTDCVPTARMSRRWVLRRAFRSGNSAVRVDLVLAASAVRRARARVLALARGVPRLLAGGARWALGCLIGSHAHRARGLRTAARGAGMVAGTVGVAYQEYRRSPARLSRSH
jgi:glycosyltransferase involved in cell wall biosynthesis